MRVHLLVTVAMLLGCADAAAVAQDTGAFDMGQLTGSLAQDHITQSERARARRQRGNVGRQAEACAGLPRYRKQYGAGHPQVMRLESLCRRAGYRIR